jgi:hypothetical protein
MKAEERLRAAVAEASYQAYLEQLKHRECVQEDECLDLVPIDNSKRGISEPPVPITQPSGKKSRKQGWPKEEEGMRVMF